MVVQLDRIQVKFDGQDHRSKFVVAGRNKWPKNFDERLHRMGILWGGDLM